MRYQWPTLTSCIDTSRQGGQNLNYSFKNTVSRQSEMQHIVCEGSSRENKSTISCDTVLESLDKFIFPPNLKESKFFFAKSGLPILNQPSLQFNI